MSKSDDENKDLIPTPRPLTGIKPPQALVTTGQISESWKLFIQKWKNYAILTQLNKQSMEYQVALFLHSIGDDALVIYNGFVFKSAESDRTVDEIIDEFTKYAIGEINESYERFKFNQCIQKKDETVEQFLTNVRTLVKTCNYCKECVDSIIRDRIILGVNDAEVQETLLKERNPSLKKCIDIIKAAESAQNLQ